MLSRPSGVGRRSRAFGIDGNHYSTYLDTCSVRRSKFNLRADSSEGLRKMSELLRGTRCRGWVELGEDKMSQVGV